MCVSSQCDIKSPRPRVQFLAPNTYGRDSHLIKLRQSKCVYESTKLPIYKSDLISAVLQQECKLNLVTVRNRELVVTKLNSEEVHNYITNFQFS